MKKLLVVLFLVVSCAEKKADPDLVISDRIERTSMSVADSTQLLAYIRQVYATPLHSQEHQKYLDSALVLQPDNAWLWQQKAMPLYKIRKYQLGKPFLANAVQHDPEKWLAYSGFMKCIFSKEYRESTIELMEAKERFGDGYIMDHTYNFYIGLNYLQDNEFEKAQTFFLKSRAQQFADSPDVPPYEACHYLDWFYLGITEFEQQRYEKAIQYFDISLLGYENFADALYFKARSLSNLGQVTEGTLLEKKAFEMGHLSINEDNAVYEIYPYQIFHKLNERVREK